MILLLIKRERETEENRYGIGSNHIPNRVICSGVLDGGNPGGEHVNERGPEGDESDRCHVVPQSDQTAEYLCKIPVSVPVSS